MIYPRFLEKGATIGITAPSDGNKKITDFVRLDNGKRKLIDRGYRVIESKNVRTSTKGRSSDKLTRANQFMDLINNREVQYIISAKGGDFLMEMLPYLDYEGIKANPKWVQGYSDNTGLIHSITTLCDIPTVYGCNFNDFGMEYWHQAIQNNIDIIEGKKITQESFDLYEDGFFDKITGLEGYTLEKPVYWKNAYGVKEINLTGIMLGGCLDVLLNLVGTPYDNTKEFIEKHKEEGIIWYLESFALNSESITRGLWQLKEAGWFQYTKGFIFGRPMFYDNEYEISYEESVLTILDELKVAVVFDADIGHKAPQMTIINGGLANIISKEGKGSITFQL